MEKSGTTMACWAYPVWQVLKSLDIDPTPIFQQSGIDPDTLQNPLNRIADAKLSDLWMNLLLATGKADIALEVAKHVTPATFYALGFSALASRNAKEALDRIFKYSEMISDSVTLSLSHTNGDVHLNIHVDPDLHHPVSTETLFAAFSRMAKHHLTWDLPIKEIHLMHQDFGSGEALTSFFGCQVCYGQPAYKMVFSGGSLLKEGLFMANPALANANDLIADQHLAFINESNVMYQVKEIIHQCMENGSLAMKDVASALHMSERTLQLRLQQQGVSYQKVVNEVRASKAKQWLQNGDRNVSEIAWALGFAEVSSFSRAFKRWTGYSPNAYLKSSHLSS